MFLKPLASTYSSTMFPGLCQELSLTGARPFDARDA